MQNLIEIKKYLTQLESFNDNKQLKEFVEKEEPVLLNYLNSNNCDKEIYRALTNYLSQINKQISENKNIFYDLPFILAWVNVCIKEKEVEENMLEQENKSNNSAVIIKWNDIEQSVFIKTPEREFMLDASQPSYYCSWDDAVRHLRDNGHPDWKLPDIEQLVIISKYLKEINDIIEENNGFDLKDACYWSSGACENDDFSAGYVWLYNGKIHVDYKGELYNHLLSNL